METSMDNEDSTPSVSIVTILKKGVIHPFIDALKKQKYSEPFEIIVVEGGNRSQARNLGIAQSKAPLISFIDADCEPPNNWLKSIITSLPDDQKVAGLGGVSNNSDPQSYLNKSINGVFSTFLGSLNSPSLISIPSKKRHYVNAISCHNCIYRKSVLNSVKGFDKKYEINEDTDISARLREKGYKLFLDTSISVNHNRRKTIKDFIAQFFWYGVGRFRSILTSRRNLDMKIIGLFFSTVLIAFLTIFSSTVLYITSLSYLFAIILSSIIGAFKVGSIKCFIFMIPLFFFEHFSYLFGLFFGIYKGPWKEPKSNREIKFKKYLIMNSESSS
jgi:GT2 family glycosyltransferase